MTQQRLAIIRQHQLPVTATQSTNGNQESSPRDGTNGSAIVTNQNPAGKLSAPETAPNAIETELSVCTDSMDSNSLHDVEDL